MLSLETEKYLQPSARRGELLVGIGTGLLALLMLYVATYSLVNAARLRVFSSPQMRPSVYGLLIVVGIELAIGLPAAWVSFRLLAARRAKDGGLFSPPVLRVGCAVLLVAAAWRVWAQPLDPFHWSDAVTLGTGAVAAWILASRRERLVAESPERGPARGGPID